MDNTRQSPAISEGIIQDTPSPNEDTKPLDQSEGGLESNRLPYRQKYKPAWELDVGLRDWLSACTSDEYAAFCRFCRTKLHAHKKGLLAHAQSAKHKKHVGQYESSGQSFESSFHNHNHHNLTSSDHQESMCIDETTTTPKQQNGDLSHLGSAGDLSDGAIKSPNKRIYKYQRVFNDSWISEPAFSQWLRRVPNNKAKAVCIACRCILYAGRCELMKHTNAAKHKRAISEGHIEELSDTELQQLCAAAKRESHRDSSDLGDRSLSMHRISFIDSPGLLVDDVLGRLEKHVPLDMAEKWDNVGVITKPTQQVRIHHILLTIDLNEKIVSEAIKKRVQFILAYHPPIFTPIKSLNPKRWKDRTILQCIENKITVYSPHTALDAVKGGINDWLINPFVSSDDNNRIRPIVHSCNKLNSYCLEVLLSEPQETVAQLFKDVNNVTMTDYGNSSTEARVTCDASSLPELVEHLANNNLVASSHLCSSRVSQLAPTPLPGIGMGRIISLATPLQLFEVIQRIKAHLNLTYVRVACPPKVTRDAKISSIAVCAGSGSSILKECKQADVWVTGEMSHHDVLDAINNGTSVILCEHSNTERGFLRDWAQQLKGSVFEDQVMVSVSEIDRDPLKFV